MEGFQGMGGQAFRRRQSPRRGGVVVSPEQEAGPQQDAGWRG